MKSVYWKSYILKIKLPWLLKNSKSSCPLCTRNFRYYSQTLWFRNSYTVNNEFFCKIFHEGPIKDCESFKPFELCVRKNFIPFSNFRVAKIVQKMSYVCRKVGVFLISDFRTEILISWNIESLHQDFDFNSKFKTSRSNCDLKINITYKFRPTY